MAIIANDRGEGWRRAKRLAKKIADQQAQPNNGELGIGVSCQTSPKLVNHGQPICV